MAKPSAIVVGAGIVGLAAARALAVKGYEVTVFERHPKAIGASIRNFGMVWPIGQPNGHLYTRAMRSREIWKSLLTEAGIWHRKTGSLLAARLPEEMAVLEEFMQKDGRSTARLLSAAQAVEQSPALKADGLLGALWSDDEMIVDPREAIRLLPALLTEKYGIHFIFGQVVNRVKHPAVWAGTQRYQADEVWICSGQDFETLYPEVFNSAPITKCKLQMMRTTAQPNNWNIGASLSAGLTLIHYRAFENLESLAPLKALYAARYPEHLAHGVHVLVSQNGMGEITLGDTHEYGLHLDPFDQQSLNDLVLDYLSEFAMFPEIKIAEYWNGTYAKCTDGNTEYVGRPEPGVVVVNGLGGAGMTMSFGLLEELVR